MKFLFITDSYYPHPRIIAVLVHNVAKSLHAAGHLVDVLSVSDGRHSESIEVDGIHVVKVKPDLQYRLTFLGKFVEAGTLKGKASNFLGGILSKLKKLCHINDFPLASRKIVRRLAEAGKKMDSKQNYDAIVAVYWPIECLYAALEMKDQSSARMIIMEPDAFPPDGVYRLPKKIALVIIENWIKKIYGGFDVVLRLPGNEKWFQRDDVQKSGIKVLEMGLPMLVRGARSDTAARGVSFLDKASENWVYSGSLNPPNYDPRSVVDTFLALPQDVSRTLYFVSQDFPEYCIEKAEKSNGRIKLLPYMPHKDLVVLLEEADVLVSMKSSSRISGKAFEYMGFEKPIIHFSCTPDDPDVQYINQYDLSVVIRTYEGDLDSWVLKTQSGLKAVQNAAKNFDYENLKMFTPEFTRDVIVSEIQGTQ